MIERLEAILERLDAMEEQIADEAHDMSRLGISVRPEQVRDSNGHLLLMDVIIAKANVLSAMANLTKRNDKE